jgi:RNA polymerase sigma-70 factor (ECF subfamily)
MAEHPSPSPDQGTSLTLLARLRDHDPDAWSLVVRLYTPAVRQWAVRSGLQSADLEDLTQEVFRVAASGLQNFRRDRPGDSFRGWLYGITRNFVLKHFERRQQAPQASGGTDAYLRLQEVAAPTDDTADALREDKRSLYLRALELLKEQFEEKTWQAFWLTVIDEVSPDEVAERLGLSGVAIRKYKSRVLQRLRAELGEVLD